MAILQLGLTLYARNTLAACAQEGARYAAAEDISLLGAEAVTAAAVARATSCVDSSLSNRFSQGVTASTPVLTDAAGGPVQVVEVQIAGPVPLVGLFGVGPQWLHVKADAMQEQP
jgi:hypothetical protein